MSSVSKRESSRCNAKMLALSTFRLCGSGRQAGKKFRSQNVLVQIEDNSYPMQSCGDWLIA